MKDWNTLEADEVKLLTLHYTPGRNGRKINKVVIHHNAGNLSINGCWQVWQTREASAHYQVDASGRIGQLVYDDDTAWHAGNLEANLTSIGIEHADINTNPWTISDATLDNGAHLVAAICKFYGLGRPEWGKNVFPHSHFSSTACPCSLSGSQNAAYMAKAQEWYDKMTGATNTDTTSKPTTGKKTVEQVATEVINGLWGNGADRTSRLTAAGYDAAAVQARVNELLGATTSATADIDDLARRVIAGEFGTGNERRNALGSLYDQVQARVNKLLGAGNVTPVVNLDSVADAVIRGDYGNGADRAARLTAAGYDPTAVQTLVNKKLGF